MDDKQTYHITWQGIAVQIDFVENESKAYEEIMGEILSHIEVRASEPLPITETGYRSLFIGLPVVEEESGAVALVERWLNESAESEEWKQYQKEKMQLTLF